MVGLLIIAHAPLASALRTVAEHTFPGCAPTVMALDVPPEMTPEEIEERAGLLLEEVRDPDAVVFTDVFGATPCNVAQKLAGAVENGHVKVVTGVNVPMLWRSLCYAKASESADTVAERAIKAATQGVMQLASSKPQNQTLVANDQDGSDNQQ